jgi:hypothetical protein
LRVNTYSVVLNKQELRNGKYFGYFKSTVYQLALDYLNFWRASGIFTESAIARMHEAELTSELLILQLDGLQDKKNSIEDFYAHLDEEWGEEPIQWLSRGTGRPLEWLSRKEAERRFRVTLEEIGESIGDLLPESEFSRVPLFYTLYGVIYHRQFGVPGFNYSTPARPLSANQRRKLRGSVEVLSSLLADKPEPDTAQSDIVRQFMIASARQTDNLAPRRKRLEIVWRLAELSS